MLEKPKNVGELRALIADTLWEVRYGHVKPEILLAMKEGFDSINDSLNVECKAWALLASVGQLDKQRFGDLPLDCLSERSKISP